MAKRIISTTVRDSEDKSAIIDYKTAIPYQQGKYDPTVTYIRNEISYPIVKYGELYYYLNLVGEHKLPAGETPASDYALNGADATWVLADNFKVLMADIAFAEFAKMGSFVFDKNRLMSSQGSTDNYTDANFIPNFEVDGASGKMKAKDAEISGKVDADEGSIGVLNVNKSGQVSVLDPSNGAERLIINADNIPALNSLINGTNTSGSVNNNSRLDETSVYTFPTKLVVPKNGSNIRIQTSLGLYMMGGSQGELAGSAYTTLELKLGNTGMPNLVIEQVMLTAKTDTINEQTIPIDRTFTGMPSGTYSLVLRVAKVGDVNTAKGRTTSSTLSYTHQEQGVSRAQIGLDGFMLYYTQNHFHFTANQGLKIGGDVSIEGNTNINGILLAVDKRIGSFSNTTSFNQKWGIARLTNVLMSRVGKVVKLYHYLGHTNYFVYGSINAGTSGIENIKTYTNYCEVTMAGNISDNHNIQLMLIGQNK